ncbi:hypothetical protein BpHYR1_037558 [Brachionus plicatilis]|uniref:Uncharacterized protein n=1 Tax=Brachionus plicatilis TaxID=10195 RepID=A0A3M7QJN7_BRAPC|nr:hypothetical protein BpHYR1_037558 [Brachionus plicatilis]
MKQSEKTAKSVQILQNCAPFKNGSGTSTTVSLFNLANPENSYHLIELTEYFSISPMPSSTLSRIPSSHSWSKVMNLVVRAVRLFSALA